MTSRYKQQNPPARWPSDAFNMKVSTLSNRSKTKDRIWPHFQTPQSSSKIIRRTLYFKLPSVLNSPIYGCICIYLHFSSRCSEMRSITVFRNRYISYCAKKILMLLKKYFLTAYQKRNVQTLKKKLSK